MPYKLTLKFSPNSTVEFIKSKKGQADALNSAFHLTYNMVLNLLRVEDINPEWLLEKSFYQFQHCAKVPKMITALDDLEGLC